MKTEVWLEWKSCMLKNKQGDNSSLLKQVTVKL